jgi:hypothetical protein
MSSKPVYILIRTSGRPRYFARMMETIKEQTYKNIVTIVHSDDPRDEYVTGDMIIHGAAYGQEFGDGTYNLYNNRLLKSIPEGEGWYHFIDDDDLYASPDVIERLVASSKRDHVNVARVQRIRGGKKVVYPNKWGRQRSYQTECFFLHTDHRKRAKWWGNTGGDHYYSKQLTRVLPINWIDDLLICKAQEAKGCGKKLDLGLKRCRYDSFPADKIVCCLGLAVPRNKIKRNDPIRHGEYRNMPYAEAVELEKQGRVKITYPPKKPERPEPRNIYQY